MNVENAHLLSLSPANGYFCYYNYDAILSCLDVADTTPELPVSVTPQFNKQTVHAL